MDQNTHVAIQAPTAPRTWEAQEVLLGTQQETGRIPIQFNRPVMLVSLYPSISVNGPTGGLIVPSLDDINVYLDISSNTRLTARFDANSPPNTEAGQLVTLGSFRDSTGGARIMKLLIRARSSTLGVNFAWKRSIVGGPYYPNIIVGLAAAFLYIDEAGNVVDQECCGG